jgi:hypothetical protein
VILGERIVVMPASVGMTIFPLELLKKKIKRSKSVNFAFVIGLRYEFFETLRPGGNVQLVVRAELAKFAEKAVKMDFINVCRFFADSASPVLNLFQDVRETI